MTKEIQVETHVVLLKGGIKLWITEEQFEGLKIAVTAGKEFVEVAGSLFATASINLIAPARAIDEADKIKRGEWKCKYNEWHEPRQECAHGY